MMLLQLDAEPTMAIEGLDVDPLGEAQGKWAIERDRNGCKMNLPIGWGSGFVFNVYFSSH